MRALSAIVLKSVRLKYPIDDVPFQILMINKLLVYLIITDTNLLYFNASLHALSIKLNINDVKSFSLNTKPATLISKSKIISGYSCCLAYKQASI